VVSNRIFRGDGSLPTRLTWGISGKVPTVDGEVLCGCVTEAGAELGVGERWGDSGCG
jgi:hypothetical protein